jgi:hypothetical protein
MASRHSASQASIQLHCFKKTHFIYQTKPKEEEKNINSIAKFRFIALHSMK